MYVCMYLCLQVYMYVNTWKKSLKHYKWNGGDGYKGNSMWLGSIWWSAIFLESLTMSHPRKASSCHKRVYAPFKMSPTLMEMYQLFQKPQEDMAHACTIQIFGKLCNNSYTFGSCTIHKWTRLSSRLACIQLPLVNVNLYTFKDISENLYAQ